MFQLNSATETDRQLFNQFVTLVTSYYDDPTQMEVRPFAMSFAQAKMWFETGLIGKLEISRQSKQYGFPIQVLPDRRPVDIENFISLYWPGTVLTAPIVNFPETSNPSLQLDSDSTGSFEVVEPMIAAELEPLTITNGMQHRVYMIDPNSDLIGQVKKLGSYFLYPGPYTRHCLFVNDLKPFPMSVVIPDGDDFLAFYRINYNPRSDPRVHQPGHHYVQVIFHDFDAKRILLSRRTLNVPLFKNAWQSAVCGKVDFGKGLLEAAQSECFEEIGVKLVLPDKCYLFSYRHVDSNMIDTHVHTFLVGSPMSQIPAFNKEPHKAQLLGWQPIGMSFDRIVPSLQTYLELYQGRFISDYLADFHREPDTAFMPKLIDVVVTKNPSDFIKRKPK